MIVETAHTPLLNQDGTIDLMVKFSHLPYEVPFTANPEDITEEGRQIHADAVAGLYGLVGIP